MSGVSFDPGYGRLKDLIIAATGLAFYVDRDDSLEGVIAGRLSQLGMPDCSGYASFLAGANFPGGEMDVLISALTIGETSFFRDEDQFAAIRDVVFAEIVARNSQSRLIRIWSAGCSTEADPGDYCEFTRTAGGYGMPAAAVRMGVVCESLPLHAIRSRVLDLVSREALTSSREAIRA